MSCPGLPRPSAAAHPEAPLDAQDEGREGIRKSHPTPSLGQSLPGFLFLPGKGWRVRKGLVRERRTREQVESKAMPEARETSGNHVCSRPGRTWSPREPCPTQGSGPARDPPWTLGRHLGQAGIQGVMCALGDSHRPPGSEPLFPPCGEQITSTG